MGFRDKVHAAIAAKKKPGKPLSQIVFVSVVDADRTESGEPDRKSQDAWLIEQAMYESVFAGTMLEPIIDQPGLRMTIRASDPASRPPA